MTENWVQPYEASPWVRSLAGTSSALPLGIAVAGVAAAAAVAFILYSGILPKVRGPQGGPPWPQFLGALGLTLICLGLNLILCMMLGSGGGFAASAREMGQAAGDFRIAGEQAKALNVSGLKVASDLGRLLTECPPQVKMSLGSSVQKVEDQVKTFLGEVEHFSGIMAGIEPAVAQLEQKSSEPGALLPLYLPLSILAILVGCIAVVLPIALEGQYLPLPEQTVRSLQQYKLSFLGLVCVAPAVFLTSVLCAAELFIDIGSGSLCASEPDTALMRYAQQEFAHNPDGLQFASYYIEGKGQNPVLVSLGTAQSEIDSCITWVEEYSLPLGRACPQFSFDGVVSDLRALQIILNRSENLLAPRNMYQHYHASVHEIGCGSAVAELGWLVIFQALLGLLCLPAVALTGSCLLDSLETRREYHPLSREETGGQEDGKEEFNPMYYAVYTFAVFTFIVGALMYFIPSTAIVRRISGTALYGCGIFLLSNSDLIVTYVRMKMQMGMMEKNNRLFEEHVGELETETRGLKQAQKGLQEIDQKFGGSVEQAIKEVEKLEINARTNLAQCARVLCRLYADKRRDHLIERGPELDNNFEMMECIFKGIVKGYSGREQLLRVALNEHPKFQSDGRLKGNTFEKLMECMLSEEPSSNIPDAVKRLMDDDAAKRGSVADTQSPTGAAAK